MLITPIFQKLFGNPSELRNRNIVALVDPILKHQCCASPWESKPNYTTPEIVVSMILQFIIWQSMWREIPPGARNIWGSTGVIASTNCKAVKCQSANVSTRVCIHTHRDAWNSCYRKGNIVERMEWKWITIVIKTKPARTGLARINRFNGEPDLQPVQIAINTEQAVGPLQTYVPAGILKNC